MKHRSVKKEAAIALLAKNLREVNDSNDFCRYNVFGWRSNYGVFEKLKFHTSDEMCYFETSKHLIPVEERKTQWPVDNEGWFKKGVDRGRILFEPDISIFHKGSATIHIYFVDGENDNDFMFEVMNMSDFGYVEVYFINVDDFLNRDNNDEYFEVKQVTSIL